MRRSWSPEMLSDYSLQLETFVHLQFYLFVFFNFAFPTYFVSHYCCGRVLYTQILYSMEEFVFDKSSAIQLWFSKLVMICQRWHDTLQFVTYVLLVCLLSHDLAHLKNNFAWLRLFAWLFCLLSLKLSSRVSLIYLFVDFVNWRYGTQRFIRICWLKNEHILATDKPF